MESLRLLKGPVMSNFAGFNWAELYDTAEAVSFEPIPSGTYLVQIVEATVATASTGREMIKIQYAVVGGPHDKRKLFDQWVLSPDNAQALGFFFAKAQAAGLSQSFFASLPPGSPGQGPDLGPVAAALEGRQLRAVVGTRTYQDVKRNDVKRLLPAPTQAVPGMGAVSAGASQGIMQSMPPVWNQLPGQPNTGSQAQQHTPAQTTSVQPAQPVQPVTSPASVPELPGSADLPI